MIFKVRKAFVQLPERYEANSTGRLERAARDTLNGDAGTGAIFRDAEGVHWRVG